MTKFEKPGSRDWNYPDMVREATESALADAGVSYADIEQVCVGYVYADSTAGQRAVYELGLTGVPIVNVNNNCATGSSSLFLARQLVEGGIVDCALAVGFEKMETGSLKETNFPGTVAPLDRHVDAAEKLWPNTDAPFALYLFGAAGREHMQRFGTTREQFARVAEKNHRHSANNPNAQFQKVYSVDEILDSPMYYDPLTRLQCSPTSDGAAAVVVASERFVEEHGLWEPAVEILGQSMVTDTAATFDDKSAISIVGAKMSQRAAREVYEQAQVGPEDVDVIELHDCFSTNELLTYEALGLCEEGEGGSLIDAGEVTFGGRWVVNPSGGLISKGHPLGATGLAQCTELTWQLRGQAGPRQVENVEYALQHNIGLGGAVVVTMYARAA